MSDPNDSPTGEIPSGAAGSNPPVIPGHSAAYPGSGAVNVAPPSPPGAPPLPPTRGTSGGGRDDRWGGGARGPVGYSEPPPKRKGSRVAPIIIFVVLVFGLGAWFFMTVVSHLFQIGFSGGGGFAAAQGMGDSQIALVRIEEPIMPGPSYDFWMNSLAEIGDNPKLKGVLIRLNSPGGSVGSSQEIYDEVLQLRKQGKKVYVSMGDVAASGAYYIAAASDKIHANRGTLTGSIGVISQFYQLQELAEKVGVDVETIKTGRFKDSGSSMRVMTDDERAMFDLLLENAYDQFLDDIISQRNTPLAKAFTDFTPEDFTEYQFETPAVGAVTREFLEQIADGRVYSGEQALKLGLVDELGSLNHSITQLAKDLKIKGEPKIYEPTRQMGFFELLQAKATGAVPSASLSPSRAFQYRMPRL